MKYFVIISLTQLNHTLYRQFIGGCLTDHQIGWISFRLSYIFIIADISQQKSYYVSY